MRNHSAKRLRTVAMVCAAMSGIGLVRQSVSAQEANPAAASAKPAPDEIVFTNGDRLSGKLLREADKSVTFHSDIAGDVTVTWDKVRSIRSSQQFAVVERGQKVTKKTPNTAVAQGAVAVENGTVSVSNAAGTPIRQIPVADTQYIIDENTFRTEILREPGFFFGWDGSLTLGATQVQATQTSQTFTGAATLLRVIPTVEWLDPRNKTTLNLSATYGLTSQPLIQVGTTVIQPASTAKTNILHGDTERDEYFTPHAYYLFDASADHNLGSGLQLQQDYGAGAGWTIVKSQNPPRQTFDLKGDLHYEQQQFYAGTSSPTGTPNVNLIGANITEAFMRELPLKLKFSETGTITPAFNVPRAYSAFGLATLNFPVYKRFSFTLSAQDNFINDPPQGFKKNTFQFTAGVTYALK